MTEDPNGICPIPVSIVEDKAERVKSATWGVWTGYVLAGTEQPFQILPQDERRRRAVIVVTGASPGIVYIGTRAQTLQQRGGVLPGGVTIVEESASERWIAPDGTHPMTVSVLLEGYRAE